LRKKDGAFRKKGDIMVDITEITDSVGSLYIENMNSPIEIHQVLVSLRSMLAEKDIEIHITSDAKDGKSPSQIIVQCGGR